MTKVTVKLDYNLGENQLSISFPFNEVLGKRLSLLGFKYNSSSKSYRCSCEPVLFYFLENLPKTVKTSRYNDIRLKYSNEIDALHLKRSNENLAFSHRLKINPLDHQFKAIKFIELNNGKCIINDEQGTGKTLISILYAVKHNLNTLIVCPDHLKHNWYSEIRKLANIEDEKLFTIMTFSEIRRTDSKDIIKLKYETIVIDEAHKLKDLKSKTFIAVNRVCKDSDNVLILTGLEISLDPMAFYSFCKFLNKDITKKSFVYRFFLTKFENNRVIPVTPKIKALQSYLSSFTLRRKLSDIKKDITKDVALLNVELSAKDYELYNKHISSIALFLTGADITETLKFLSSIKTLFLVKLLSDRISENPSYKTIVVSRFKECLDIVMKEIKNSNYYNAEMLEFPNILLLDSSTFKEGINLDQYDKMIFIDQFSDESKNVQLRRRIDRVSQKSKRLLCEILETDTLDKAIRRLPKGISYDQSLILLKKHMRLSLAS